MHTTLGSLKATVLQTDADARPVGAVVLCHGFGAPGDDLVPLQREFVQIEPALRRVRFVFPEAPMSLGSAGFGYDARAWWNIDMNEVMRLQMGDPVALKTFRAREPEGMPQARAAFLKLLDAVCTGSDLAMSHVVLGGFSQGAMLTTDVSLRADDAPAGLAILSGTLLTEDIWRVKAERRKGLRVFQSHGKDDPLLPYANAVALKELLEKATADVQFTTFIGGHSIPPGVITSLATFIKKSLAL